MRRHLALAAALAMACGAATARLLYVDDADGEFRRLGVSVTAEEVVHRGERLLLLRFDARAIPATTVGPPPVHAPVEIACERITVHTEGRTQKPHAASPCAIAEKLPRARSVPVFVAFAFPAVAREARITVPLEILEPPAPVRTRLDPRAPEPPPPRAAVPPGARVVTARVDLGPPR